MTRVEQSLKLMESLYDHKVENIIAFSGGKDSIVLYDLAKRTGLLFSYVYSNTTIDPPGHIGFIRKYYPDVQIQQPKISFYEMIEKYGLPTDRRRFCCQHLKEYVGKGCRVFEGLRIEEGRKRGARLKKLVEPEKCDTRVKGKIHAYPIMQWSEKEIWNYIRERNLPYSPLYDQGFSRLGCVGCPMAMTNLRINEYKRFPRYAYATIRAIEKNIKAGRSLSKFFQDPYEAFHWWLTRQSLSEHKLRNQGFFQDNYEVLVKKMFPLKKEDHGKSTK